MRLTVVLLLGLVAAADEPAAKAVKDERKRLEGTWAVKAATSNGKPLAPAPALFVFAGDQFTVQGKDGSPMDKGRYKIDLAKQPRTMDFTPEKLPDNGAPGRAIYRLRDKGNTLEICIGPPDLRPTAFVDRHQMLFKLERKK